MDWKEWARLVRIPTVFTILADVSAGFFLAAGGHEPWQRWGVVLVAGVLLYWSGMIFNDVFDVEQDRAERPGRPLPSGAISRARAAMVGGICMALGLGMATLSGQIPVEGLETTWTPSLVAGLLCVMILLYDGPLKRTLLGPAAMGSCRFLSLLLGASPVLMMNLSELRLDVPMYLWAAAVGMGLYVMGVTLIARYEAGSIQRVDIVSGLAIVALGLVVIAFVPRFAGPEDGLLVRGDVRFAILIGMLGFTVLARGANLISDPQPARVQMTVRVALLTLIPLSAALAFLGAGPIYGLGVFALVVPAFFVGARFRMT